MPKSKIFFFCLLAFIGGIALRSFVNVPIFYLFLLLMVGVFVTVTIRSSRFEARSSKCSIWITGLILVCFALGVGRYELSEWLRQRDFSQRIESYNEQQVEFVGMVADEADLRTDHQKLTLAVRGVLENGQLKKTKGRVLTKVDLYPRYQYGDLLKVECQLQSPEPVEDFEYDKYLERYGIYSLCYQPKIKNLASGQGDLVKAGLLRFKSYFSQRLAEVLKEPYASFMGGLLLGAKKGMPSDLLETFKRVGITHIVAISGYNITILAVVFSNLALALGLGRKKSFWLVLVAVAFFVFITGAPASIIRAAVMGMLVMLAQKLGRISKARNAIILSAVLMLLVNPKVLVFDAGFQLSFVSTLGLIYLSRPLSKLLKFLPQALSLRESASSTLAATIMTLPLIIYLFGWLSVVAVLVNLLVLPFIPLAMLVGFITGVGAMIWLPLGEVLAWPSWLVLHYIISVAEFFAGFSWAAIEIPKVETWLLVVGYLVLGFVVLMANRLVKPKAKIQ